MSNERRPGPDERLGLRLNNRYQLAGQLGQGGMSTVYRAHDILLERDVAVKVLTGTGLTGEQRARLLVEAKAAARLNHPNIVAVYDAGEAGDSAFIVMELVEGQSLHEYRPRDLDEILSIARQMCAALEHAHRHGIVHRDLKPENVLIAADGTAKLADFGLAHSIASRLSAEGTVVGTVLYLAPEQALGGEVDGRADLYALGVMLYEMVAGRLPFGGDDPLAVIYQHLHAPPVPPHTFIPDLPAPLEETILKLLAKNPANRYPSAAELGRRVVMLSWAAPLQSPAAVPTTGSLVKQLSSGRLVGRQAEVARLLGLWTEAQQGSAQLVLISGEPGVGKTRLASELVVYAELVGATVLQGGCSETMIGLPYLPFVEALHNWMHDQNSQELRERLGSNASELARLSPEIETRLAPLQASPALSPNEERLRLFHHVGRFLQSLAADRGLLLFVDDLHWADQGTLALLRYLTRALRKDRVLLLATYRDTELHRKQRLAGALAEWDRSRAVSRLSLARLTASETGELLAMLFGGESVTDEFVAAVHAETEGNPFFVEEVVKDLVERGQIYREGGEWQCPSIGELAIPRSIVDAIGQRLGRLSASCLEVLRTAAVVGGSFVFQELSAVADLSQDELLNVLDEAEAFQLVRSGEEQRYAFTHDKIAEVLYQELNPVRRQRLHLRTGEALEGLYAGDLASHASVLASHFVRGGDRVRALRYLGLAGQEAARVYAYDEALANYGQAAGLAQALGRPDEQGVILETMASLHARRGQVDQAVAHYEQALALTTVAADEARLKALLGGTYTGVGDERAVAYLQAALDELDPKAQPNAVAQALAALGRFHHYHGQHGSAIEFIERARQIAEPQDDPATLAEIYGYLAGAYAHLGRMQDSMYWARRSIALGERHNYPLAVITGYEFLTECSFELGLWEDALQYSAFNRELGERTGAQLRVFWAGLSRGSALYGLGNLQAAATAAQETLSGGEQMGDVRLAVLAGASLAIAQTDLGLDDAALRTASLVLERGEGLGQVFMRCVGRHALGHFHCQRHEWAQAVALYDECYQLLEPSDSILPLCYLGPRHARACLGLGQLDKATASLDRFLSAAQDLGSLHHVAMGRRVEGQILMARGDMGAAARALDEAVTGLRQTGSRLELGRALYQRSKAHEAVGNVDQSHRDREEALAILTQCGAVRDVERAGAA